MFKPVAILDDINNLLGITGINQKIIDICNNQLQEDSTSLKII